MKRDENLMIYRIKFEFPPENFGGSVKHILELSTAINPFVKKQIIFVPLMGNSNRFDETFPIEIIRVDIRPLFFVPGLSLLNIIIFSFFTIKKIKILSIDYNNIVIHVHGFLLGGMISFFRHLFRISVPVIVMIHGGYSDKTRYFSIAKKIEKIVMSLFPPEYCILLNDGTDINSIEAWLKRKTIPYLTVLHGIDTDFFQVDNSNKFKNSFIILFPHRPVPFKRPDLALKIFKKFLHKSKAKDCKLVIFAASESIEIQKNANNLGISHFVEFLDVQDRQSVKEYLNKCSVVIGTSLESNMGRSIQEAMACEKTVVVFDNGRMTEFIQNWENGIVIEAGNIEKFADTLQSLYEHQDQLVSIGKKARNTILRERSWDNRVERELIAYKTIIKQSLEKIK
jgi:glycosyltransferase involved in cell wall biosynthesis